MTKILTEKRPANIALRFNILKVWRIKKLLIERRITTVFKSLVFKATHLVIVLKLKTTYCSTTI